MKVIITDEETLHSLSPAEMAAYLRSHHWEITREIGDKGAVWHRSGESSRSPEILLPLRRDLDDYAERIADVLQILAETEASSQIDLLKDITESAADIIRIRLQGPAYDDGSLPIEQAAQVVEQARELMLAAACSTVQPRQVYRTRKPAQAIEYMHKVRLGQTERGSYVLNIRSAVPPRFSEKLSSPGVSQSVIGSDEPFERRVTLMLSSALAITRSALAHIAVTGDLTPFQDAVQEGVSANLCAALAGLNLEGNTQNVDIDFQWSPMRPLPFGTAPQTRIRLSGDTLTTLGEVARELRERTAYEDFELNGVVTALHREKGEGKGQITITGLVDGSLRKIRVDLEASTYDLALSAHTQQLYVACEGELERDGRSYRLLSPRRFIVTPEV